jgi:hypothetical protein
MVCAVPAQVRRVPWHAQPCVEEIQKQAYKKKKKMTRYDIFELEGEERRTDKRRTWRVERVVDERTQQPPRLGHSEDPGHGYVVVFLD